MITLADEKAESDGVITALQSRIRDTERSYDHMTQIAQLEILRLQNRVAQLERDKADLQIAFDLAMEMHKPVLE